jgi:hypothetical protein
MAWRDALDVKSDRLDQSHSEQQRIKFQVGLTYYRD